MDCFASWQTGKVTVIGLFCQLTTKIGGDDIGHAQSTAESYHRTKANESCDDGLVSSLETFVNDKLGAEVEIRVMWERWEIDST